ncbi:MAG TPA: clostripain-related cysteine peptidase [Elusimicrobiales bacterium]|nr:clostripain-related cysteine peptidase [Elusimicrobiales bacterium]HPO95587.1 clostripain-related cysteine peptidase [Elusimicrobiales bacterium]
MKIMLSVLSLFLVSFGYSEINFDGNSKLNIKESLAQIEVPSVSADKKHSVNSKELKEWTIMVFVNAKNNLESYGLSDVNEMEMVGSTDKINIVAELGRISGYSNADGDWKGCKRYYVTKDSDKTKITSPVLADNPKCDMGSWEYMVDFVNWAKANYPAKKYVLVVWNHGSGWDKGGNISEIMDKGISYDDETRNHITTQQLRMALEKIGGVNILAMDACLMQMIEVAYEIKDYAEYVVASEETEPADGYTYNTWLEPLAAKPVMDSKELSVAMVNSYTDHYQSISQGATQSSVNAKALSKLAAMSDEFITAVMEANDITNAKNARTNAQKFYYSTNKDFYHFVKLITDATQIPEVKSKGQALLDYLKNNAITYNRAYGSKYSNAYGLAVYVPTYYTTSYDELMWAKESKWDDFIKWMK